MSIRRKLGLAAATAIASAMLAAPANAAHATAGFTKITGTMKACTFEVPQVTVQGQCFEVPVQTSLRPGEVQDFHLGSWSRPDVFNGYRGDFEVRVGVTAARTAYVWVRSSTLWWLSPGSQLKVSVTPSPVGRVIPIEPSANFSDFSVNSFCSNAPTPNCSRSILDVALASDVN
ncbi:hypothetical protein ABZW49_27245 [Nonomuraea wenchangensis]